MSRLREPSFKFRASPPAGRSENQVRQIIQQHTEQRTWGLLGEPRVNVLEVNLALDQAKAMAAK